MIPGSSGARRDRDTDDRSIRMNRWHTSIAAGSAAAGLCVWGACHPASQLFGRTLRRTGRLDTLALTFDDGPDAAVTPRLLELLTRYGAVATFFLIGDRVHAHPSVAREIAARGHAVGNHTATHRSLMWLSPQRIFSELSRCQEALENAVGRRAVLMRPPYGFRGPQLRSVLGAAGLSRVVMWSRTARDWDPQPSGHVIERLRRARGGDIVLLHDGDHRTSHANREHTLQALEFWLPRWIDAGLRCVALGANHDEREAVLPPLIRRSEQAHDC